VRCVISDREFHLALLCVTSTPLVRIATVLLPHSTSCYGVYSVMASSRAASRAFAFEELAEALQSIDAGIAHTVLTGVGFLQRRLQETEDFQTHLQVGRAPSSVMTCWVRAVISYVQDQQLQLDRDRVAFEEYRTQTLRKVAESAYDIVGKNDLMKFRQAVSPDGTLRSFNDPPLNVAAHQDASQLSLQTATLYRLRDSMMDEYAETQRLCEHRASKLRAEEQDLSQRCDALRAHLNQLEDAVARTHEQLQSAQLDVATTSGSGRRAGLQAHTEHGETGSAGVLEDDLFLSEERNTPPLQPPPDNASWQESDGIQHPSPARQPSPPRPHLSPGEKAGRTSDARSHQHVSSDRSAFPVEPLKEYAPEDLVFDVDVESASSHDSQQNENDKEKQDHLRETHELSKASRRATALKDSSISPLKKAMSKVCVFAQWSRLLVFDINPIPMQMNVWGSLRRLTTPAHTQHADDQWTEDYAETWASTSAWARMSGNVPSGAVSQYPTLPIHPVDVQPSYIKPAPASTHSTFTRSDSMRKRAHSGAREGDETHRRPFLDSGVVIPADETAALGEHAPHATAENPPSSSLISVTPHVSGFAASPPAFAHHPTHAASPVLSPMHIQKHVLAQKLHHEQPSHHATHTMQQPVQQSHSGALMPKHGRMLELFATLEWPSWAAVHRTELESNASAHVVHDAKIQFCG
jgi:multidrug transporter EmrE-like cation transporter